MYVKGISHIVIKTRVSKERGPLFSAMIHLGSEEDTIGPFLWELLNRGYGFRPPVMVDIDGNSKAMFRGAVWEELTGLIQSAANRVKEKYGTLLPGKTYRISERTVEEVMDEQKQEVVSVEGRGV